MKSVSEVTDRINDTVWVLLLGVFLGFIMSSSPTSYGLALIRFGGLALVFVSLNAFGEFDGAGRLTVVMDNPIKFYPRLMMYVVVIPFTIFVGVSLLLTKYQVDDRGKEHLAFPWDSWMNKRQIRKAKRRYPNWI